MKTYMIMHEDGRMNGAVFESPACGESPEAVKAAFEKVRAQAKIPVKVLSVREAKKNEEVRERMVPAWELERLGLKGAASA